MNDLLTQDGGSGSTQGDKGCSQGASRARVARTAAGWLLVSALSGGLLGCQKKAPLPSEQVASAPAAVAAAVDLEGKRRLALQKSEGGQPVDVQLGNLQAAIARNPGKLDFWIALGRAWVRKARESAEPGYYLNADAAAEVALHMAPDAPLALDLRGLVLLNDHRFDEARQLAQQAIAKDARDAMAYGSLADALLELGKYDEAAAAVQQMMQLKPNMPAYARASYLAWLRGDGRTAKELIRHAIDSSSPSAHDPEPRAWAVVQAAHLFFHEGDYEGADAGYRTALQTFADYPPALVGRARVAIARNDLREAIALLRKAYAQSPLLETAVLLAETREAAGDNQGAQEQYDQIIRQGRRTDPRTLALFLATHRRDPAEAVRLIEEELKRRGDLYTQDVYAVALYAAGRYADARAAIEPVVRLGVRDARILYHAGAIALAAGDTGRASALLADALKLNPHFDLRGAADAAELLRRESASAQLAAR
jgi:tetratricopeptide (TPR) repeat protein